MAKTLKLTPGYVISALKKGGVDRSTTNNRLRTRGCVVSGVYEGDGSKTNPLEYIRVGFDCGHVWGFCDAAMVARIESGEKAGLIKCRRILHEAGYVTGVYRGSRPANGSNIFIKVTLP